MLQRCNSQRRGASAVAPSCGDGLVLVTVSLPRVIAVPDNSAESISLGESCNGFTLPWFYERCEPVLVCDTPEFIADAPGIDHVC